MRAIDADALTASLKFHIASARTAARKWGNRMSITDGTWLVIFGFCIGILVGGFIGRLK